MDSSSLSSITYEVLYPRDCRYRALLSTHLFVVSTHAKTNFFCFHSHNDQSVLHNTNSCSTIRKGRCYKPDVPNDCDWYVWRGNGKGYVKQLRTIASIDDRTDGNNRPNKRNRTIDM